MSTVSVRGDPFGSVIDDALENVPSLPTQVRLYVIEPFGPLFRTKVYCRVYGVLIVTPSRSWIPRPFPGVARNCSSAVSTGTDELMSTVWMFVWSSDQASLTWSRPLRCS